MISGNKIERKIYIKKTDKERKNYDIIKVMKLLFFFSEKAPLHTYEIVCLCVRASKQLVGTRVLLSPLVQPSVMMVYKGELKQY